MNSQANKKVALKVKSLESRVTPFCVQDQGGWEYCESRGGTVGLMWMSYEFPVFYCYGYSGKLASVADY